MVTRIAVLLSVLALLITACGGGEDDSSNNGNTGTSLRPTGAEATSTPSGPRAVVEPKAGPPGIEVTVRGSGFEPGVLVDLTGELAAGLTADPYETVVAGQDGTFSARFRLETAPDGTALSTGRYNLIARSASNEITIPFLVETRRPVAGSGPTG